MKNISLFILLALMCGFSLPAQSAPHGPAAFLQKLDRQLCAKFRSLKCHRGKRHVGPSNKSKSKASKPADRTKAIETPTFPAPIPQPVPKPQNLPALKTPAISPLVKPPLIVPFNKTAAVMPRVKDTVKPSVMLQTPVIATDRLPSPTIASGSEDGNCLTALKLRGMAFDAVAQPAGSSNCIVRQPVQLKFMLIGRRVLQFPDHPILNCRFALHFTEWLQDFGEPVAIAKEGFALTQFFTGPGYVCRGRNGDISGKTSEHGFGNAIDIERLKFSDGRIFEVHDALNSTSPAYETLKAIRASACTRFTTVLGPGANTAHREHFHFDLGMHGKSSTYKICE